MDKLWTKTKLDKISDSVLCYPKAEGAWPVPAPAGALPSVTAATASDLAKEAAAVIAQKKSKRKQQQEAAAMQQGQVRPTILLLKVTNFTKP